MSIEAGTKKKTKKKILATIARGLGMTFLNTKMESETSLLKKNQLWFF